MPRCTQEDFDVLQEGTFSGDCSNDTQVGIAYVNVANSITFRVPIYNVEPNVHQAGLLGFWLPLAQVPAFITLKARTGGDFGLDASLDGVEHLIAPTAFDLRLWGVPADPIHDAERQPPGPSGAELKPFLDNPTTCGEPLTSSLEILSYDDAKSRRKLFGPRPPAAIS